jgi:hypothetical protein
LAACRIEAAAEHSSLNTSTSAGWTVLEHTHAVLRQSASQYAQY